MSSSCMSYRSTQLPQMSPIIPPHSNGLLKKKSGKAPLLRKSLLTELESPTLSCNEGKKERSLVHSENRNVQSISNKNSSQKTTRALPNEQLHRKVCISEDPMEVFLKPSQHARKFEKHLLSCPNSTTSFPAFLSSSVIRRSSQETQDTSLNEFEAQQAVLRESFDYAFKHHRVRLRKDPGVYRRECAAYCRAHPQRPHRRVRAQEVSPYTEVTLAPVTALRALAHLNPKTSSMYAVVQQGVLLQQDVMRSQLILSDQRTLVRCLRCFHVFPARPQTLWGTQPSCDDGVHTQHSWQSYHLELEKVRKAKQLRRCPHLRKKICSVGRQRADFEDNPTCCPFCGSSKAQWAMEYVHNRTHARTA
ncbi:unnamed protein product [Phytomonas sp. Hart1]|nr:unnamed protein product [Phytomonas sp. Hart1]|eukprot:CCW69145.1 unnamed protein product [Phytomonas sp. isolate Hart1]